MLPPTIPLQICCKSNLNSGVMGKTIKDPADKFWRDFKHDWVKRLLKSRSF